MLSIEVRVNGTPVGQISAHRGAWNGGYGIGGNDAEYDYPYRASFFPLHVEQQAKVYDGAVQHRYGDGIEKLAAKILSDIAETAHRFAE